MLAHARVAAGSPGHGGSAFPARQTGRFGVVELFLKLRVSFATLAIDSPPDSGLLADKAVCVCAAATKQDGDGDR